MTNQEKFENLEKLYKYAKNRDLPPSLISNLLHELLLLTFKLDTQMKHIDLFKQYIERPLEKNHELMQHSAINKQKEKFYT